VSYFIDRLPDDPDVLSGQLGNGAVIRSRAPLRVSFSGGGTDLMEYASVHGGLVLSATLARYAYATLGLADADGIRVNSLDYDTITHYRIDEPLIYDGKSDLVRGCLRRLVVNESEQRGLELQLQTDAPPGSGLGSSSAVVVAVLAALAAWQGLHLSKYELAHLAYEIERKDVGIAGGMQDQYAAVFGGFNLIEFHGEGDVVVNPLRIDDDIVRELEYNSLLVFTGGTRLSSRIIDSQLARYEEGRPDVVAALDNMKALAIPAKKALLRGRLRELGEILHEGWVLKQVTTSAVTNSSIDRMYEEARALGAIGGKMSGAGGGGFMFLICPFDRIPAVTTRLTNLGASVESVRFERDGVQSWCGRVLHHDLVVAR
jgi:D-glycero-alpha-D-manno-heptose-7-phosphate kinase